jgi:hypothetical protein
LLLWAAMEGALQEAGYGPSPWHSEFKALLQVITNMWISSGMSFMADNCINLHHNISIDGYSQKNSFLMANFIKKGASSPELTIVIQCRNFLRVSIMSEIATYCGSRVLPRMYNGEELESDTTNHWPIQPHPQKEHG